MEKRAHADRCHELPQELPDDMDLMIEVGRNTRLVRGPQSTDNIQAKDKEQAVLHLYRIYQLEEVIHENLRPEKSQEVQMVGGKRKSYSQDFDNCEALGDEKAAAKKPRRKNARKEVIEAVGRGVVGVEEAEVEKGSQARKEGITPITGRGGGAEGLRRKNPEATGERAGDGAEPQEVKRRRKRRIKMSTQA